MRERIDTLGLMELAADCSTAGVWREPEKKERIIDSKAIVIKW